MVSLKLTIVLIIGHFLTFVKFREIPGHYQNSTEKGKFCSSAQNSATHGKLGSASLGVRRSLVLVTR